MLTSVNQAKSNKQSGKPEAELSEFEQVRNQMGSLVTSR